MTVVVTGGSGFIGSALISALLSRGHKVRVLDLRPSPHPVEFVRIDLAHEEVSPRLFAGCDAVIHLAGRNIFGRWTEALKREIYHSRVAGTARVAGALRACAPPPQALISASAIGYYGSAGEEELDEHVPRGSGFLARVCADWEAAAREAERFGVRTVQVRTAPVLGKGGLLAELLPLYRLGLGGVIGNGKQWFSWIHLKDIVGVYLFALEERTLRGPVNAAAPEPVRFRDFSRTLARILKRPAAFRVPQWALRLRFGDLAEELTASARVRPAALRERGFPFSFPALEPALRDALGRGR